VPPAGGAAANPGDNIWVMDADGNDQRTLTATVAADVENQRPDWSPDGTKIVFDSNRALDGTDAPNVNGTENIWVMNADGTGLTALTQNTDGAHSAAPQWSPDGGRICFQSYLPLAQGGAPSRSYNIWVMDADGGNPAALTAVGIADAPSQFPRWSPDGSRVVFQSNMPLGEGGAATASSNIWVVDADGGNLTALTQLTAAGAASEVPQWSPDGTWITFHSQRSLDSTADVANANATANIWVVDVSGGNAAALTRLTALNANSFYPSWSPDGSKILYVSTRSFDAAADATNSGSTGNVWTMDADGTDAMALTRLDGGGPSRFAIW
ncbi:MAG: hypothetical protein WC956_07010, partial [bacterium]